MGTIAIQGVTVQIGGQVVLRDISAELHSGRITGIVGPNGAGKTTLFRLILGLIKPDMGTVTRTRGMEVGYLPQIPAIGLTHTLHDELLTAAADVLALEQRMHDLSHQMASATGEDLTDLLAQYDRVNAEFLAADGYEIEQRVKTVVSGLGFRESDLTLPVSVLSGGQKCRAALAKLLIQDSSYLLLDEPTNHLDIDAVRWLERFLTGHHGGAAIISHDRYLLDQVCDQILEVEGGRITAYSGNYSTYAETRRVQRLTQERQYEKDRVFIEKERDFIARHLAGQRSQQAKGRRTRLERELAAGSFTLERPGERRRFALNFDIEITPGKTVVSGSGLSKRYENRPLFADLDVQISAGQRLGITGPNGTGKTTLLKALLGLTPPDAGAVALDRTTRIGYHSQEADDLAPDSNLMQQIQSVRPNLDDQTIRGLLGSFLFSGEDVFKPMAALSGGERARLRLLKLVLTQPHMLVLDEPTNHLDIASREVLEEALSAYPGTIVAVSHDRYFLDRIATRLLVMRDGSHRSFTGNYSAYVEQVEREAAPPPPKPAAPPAAAPRPAAKPKGPRSRFERMPLEELEKFIEQGERRLDEYTRRFADPELARDFQGLAKLHTEFETLKAELEEAVETWGRRLQ